MTEENGIIKKPAIADMFKPMKYGIAAKREAAQRVISELDPLTMPNKLAIVFDDSGSMNGDKIKDAHTGVHGFTTQCNPKDTSIAVFPLNAEAKPLTCNFDLLNLLVSTIGATGGTPLYAKTTEMLNDAADFTRGILFSDGEPTDGSGYYSAYEDAPESRDQAKETMIALALEKKTPLDTIFLGFDTAAGYKLMKEIADRTGGIFIHFKDASSLAGGLKYLSPGLRGLLANPEIKQRIERGEQI